MSMRDGRLVRRDDISITSTQQCVRLRRLRRTRCSSGRSLMFGNDVAQVVAQSVEPRRDRREQRVGGAVAEPVRHRLRQHADQGLGAAIGVVRQHPIPLGRLRARGVLSATSPACINAVGSRSLG